jgi:hypothetical protein
VTITKQSLASIARQVLAVVATVFGILTQSDSALHLPVSVSAILTAMGPVILAIEHYVADPSTGTTSGTTTTTTVVVPPTVTAPGAVH